MSTTSGATPSSHATHKHNRVLACVLCQHRKIKCDRNTPCANCVKANVTCTPSTPAPARKRRRPNQDLQERLARCEELLKQYAGGGPPPPPQSSSGTTATPGGNTLSSINTSMSPTAQSASASPTTTITMDTPADHPMGGYPSGDDPYLQWKPRGKMIKEDGGVRLMDSYLWASVYDELRTMRDIVETEEPEEASVLGSEDLTPDNQADLFMPGETSAAHTINIDDLAPDPVHVFRLWQLFLDRVNPLTKIVHVPSLQPYVMEAATGMTGLPLNYQALLFAIYTMATVALSDAECIHMLGVSRDKAIARFSAGARTALVKYNFLKNHDMAVLQALLFYLFSLQGRFDRHAAWVFSGTVVRIAQKMGYHRDGELLGLPPFETEMRRRIWWQIVMQDAKNAMISGLSHALLPLHWDAKPPQNVNDADLFPASTEPVQPREGPTEMAFVLIVCQICKFMTSTQFTGGVPGFEAAVLGQELTAEKNPNLSNEKSIEKYRSLVAELERNMIAVEERYVDAGAGSIHAATLAIRPMLVNKLREMLVPMRDQPEWGTEIFRPKDNLFKVVIMNNEHNTEAYETMAGCGFLWFVKLHFQLDVFSVMTGQLCHRPSGSLSDRAWRVIDKIYTYHPELSDMAQKQYAHQAHYTLKAWRAREAAFAQAGQPIQAPEFIIRLQETVPGSSDATSSSGGGVGGGAGGQSQQMTPPLGGLPPQPPHHHGQQITDLDQFLGGYLDVSALNWDMWGDVTANNASMTQVPVSNYDAYSLGIGPQNGI